MKGNDGATEKKIVDALIKRALGYETTEVVEEYSGGEEDGEVKLLKKKVTKKPVPPDITALKILLEKESKSVETMTDEELYAERERLLKEISELNEEGE